MKNPIKVEDDRPHGNENDIIGNAQPLYVSYKKSPASTRFLRILKRDLPKNIGLLPFEEVGFILYTNICVFQAKIANADLVLILLSDEYLNSQYCLAELLFTFIVRTGGLDNWMSDSKKHTEMPTDMVGVIPVVLTELKTTRAKCTKYWEREASAFADRIKDRRSYTEYDTYGDATRPLMMANPKFKPLLSCLMDWVFETLVPLGTKIGADGKKRIIDFIRVQASSIRKQCV